jgi:predicted DNA-binding transcriptional regulator AlpA
MKDAIDLLRDKLIDSIMEEIENPNSNQQSDGVIHPNIDELLEIRDVIQKFGISRPTLYNWEKDGLKRTQIGGRVFFKISDLNTFIQNSRKK